MNFDKDMDVIILGGGFYGCSIALLFSQYFSRVLLIEKEQDLLQRASIKNQARVHNGYHYVRSIITASRSIINFPRFISDFNSAIVDEFEQIYAVAKYGSKTNARQFSNFFRKLSTRIDKLPANILEKIFDKNLIEDAFIVNELIFDGVILKNILKSQLEARGVKTIFAAEATKVLQHKGKLIVQVSTGKEYSGNRVFNCLYSQINALLSASGEKILPLKHEVTEMALVTSPPSLGKRGITIMDGPFFSLMPYPSRQLYTLSHVRYTPHFSWLDRVTLQNAQSLLEEEKLNSHFCYMQHDAARYIPMLSELNYVESLFEIKTVLEQNEVDDGRPILFREAEGLKNFFTVMGGKIDNIYDVLDLIKI